MRRVLFLASLLMISAVAALPLVTLNGCAVFAPQRTNDVDRLSDIEGNYNLAMEVLLYASAKGWIPAKVEDQIEEVRVAFNSAYESLETDVKAGKSIDASTYRDAVTKALHDLTLLQYQYQDKVNADRTSKGRQPVAPPVTRPVG